MSEWISVDDEMPKRGTDNLVFDKKYNKCRVAWLDDSDLWLAGIHPISRGSVSHWMPLPDAPK